MTVSLSVRKRARLAGTGPAVRRRDDMHTTDTSTSTPLTADERRWLFFVHQRGQCALCPTMLGTESGIHLDRDEMCACDEGCAQCVRGFVCCTCIRLVTEFVAARQRQSGTL